MASTHVVKVMARGPLNAYLLPKLAAELFLIAAPEKFDVPSWLADLMVYLAVILGILWLIQFIVELDRSRRPAQELDRPKEDSKESGERSESYNVELVDVIQYIISGEWGSPIDWAQNRKKLEDVKREVEQKAADGDIVIYGRKRMPNGPPLIPIPGEHWRDNGIGFLCFIKDRPYDPHSEDRGSGHSGSWNFDDLHTSKRAIERFWPPLNNENE